jgi:hypothetical protein
VKCIGLFGFRFRILKTAFGGKKALIEPADSIAGMINVLDHLASKDNGTYIDFQGNKLKW